VVEKRVLLQEVGMGMEKIAVVRSFLAAFHATK
jgi:hypothetical protein